MKILMYPDWRKGNPYQKLLEDSLKKKEVDIVFAKKNKSILPMVKMIRTYNHVDLVHIHWIDHILDIKSRNIIGAVFRLIKFLLDITIARNILKAKIVWTVHNLENHECKWPRFELFGRRYLSKKVNALICHSNAVKDKLHKIYNVLPDKIYVMPHGNYITWYENKICRNESRKTLGLNKDEIVFLFFGSIRPYKNVEGLIRVFNNVSFEKKIKLLIVGNCQNYQLQDEIFNSVKNNTNIKVVLNSIPDNEVQLYMNATDLVVLPYKDILTSGVVILAMSFGKPLIVPEIEFISDILDEKGAIFYNPNDTDGLLKAIKHAISLKEKLEEMGKNNFKIAKKMDWDSIAEKTRCVYENRIFV